MNNEDIDRIGVKNHPAKNNIISTNISKATNSRNDSTVNAKKIDKSNNLIQNNEIYTK